MGSPEAAHSVLPVPSLPRMAQHLRVELAAKRCCLYALDSQLSGSVATALWALPMSVLPSHIMCWQLCKAEPVQLSYDKP